MYNFYTHLSIFFLVKYSTCDFVICAYERYTIDTLLIIRVFPVGNMLFDYE